MAKTLTKKQLDDPKRWRVFDRWHEAQLWGALNGVFDLKEDEKVRKAFLDNKFDVVKAATDKRIKKVGKGKPKFKKPKKIGFAAREVKGTKAHAGMLLEHKMFGVPKPLKKSKTKAKKKALHEKAPHKNPESPPNPDLPQNNAYEQARAKVKKGETLLYIFLVEYPLHYAAVYYNKKAKKKIQRKIVAKIPRVDERVEERKERYENRVAMYHAVKDAIKNEKPVKAKPKKSKNSKKNKYV